MMIITTFSLDDNSKWLKHAMVTPITRKEIVSSKFIVLLIFTLLGIVISTAKGVVSNFLLNSLGFSHLISFDDLLLVFISSITISSFFGSIVIPLLFKFGVEQARILSIIAFSLPLLVCFLLYKLLSLVGVIFTDDFVKTIMYLSPLFILIWLSIMYELSYYCFKNKEIA